jgi:hypothetical protein
MEPDTDLAAKLTALTGLRWACMRCGEVCERLRAYSAAPYRGDLYVAEIPQLGVNLEQVKLLCNPCWGAMLQLECAHGVRHPHPCSNHTLR